MTDIVDRLRRFIEYGSSFTGEEVRSEVYPLLDEIERLRAEVEALRKDAARYRWLRAQDDWRYRTYPGSMASCRWTSGNSPNEIDAAIDAAMAQEPRG